MKKRLASLLMLVIGLAFGAGAEKVKKIDIDYNDDTIRLSIDRSTIKKITFTEEEPEMVDLGVVVGGKKILWAAMNIGASFPEEFGDYFAWGETAPKSNYSEREYTAKSVSVLPAEADAATVNWGANYRMPTKAEWNELINSCTWTYQVGEGNIDETSTSTKTGYIVANNSTGASIFLPAAGFYENKICYYRNGRGGYFYGYYWASTCEKSDDYADCLKTEYNTAYSTYKYEIGGNDGYFGFPVRAVSEQATE